jgi:shikimate dehydrogenase
MGAGGAARGALLPLLEHQPKTLTIANRTKQKAFELQQQFAEYGCVIPADYVDLAGHEFDIVINSTSASLNGELPSLPPCIFAAESLAYDMMYGSGLTPFLQFAGQQGAVHLSDGIGMLVEQAAESFLLWRGLRPETGPVIAMLRSET